MSALALALLELGIKYVPELIAEIATLFKGSTVTIDDAIAALDKAKTKSAQDYLDAAGGLPGETITPTDAQPTGQVTVTVPTV